MPLLPPLDRRATKPEGGGDVPLPGEGMRKREKGPGEGKVKAGTIILIVGKPNHDETDWTEDDVPPPRPCCGRRTSS